VNVPLHILLQWLTAVAIFASLFGKPWSQWPYTAS